MPTTIFDVAVGFGSSESFAPYGLHSPFFLVDLGRLLHHPSFTSLGTITSIHQVQEPQKGQSSGGSLLFFFVSRLRLEVVVLVGVDCEWTDCANSARYGDAVV
jgi:hypothetical protein